MTTKAAYQPVEVRFRIAIKHNNLSVSVHEISYVVSYVGRGISKSMAYSLIPFLWSEGFCE